MGEIIRLPGQECLYHTGGRCLYEEKLNPGYADQWRCRVLTRWESAFDDFLARAESFGVEQAAVPDLWERQFERLARQAFACESYVYCHGAEAPACVHAMDGVCRLSLPVCEGRCRHFEAQTESEDIQE